MSLSSIKAMKSQKGFTIVELLIVIVVIGILAAIVIVAFNGVQQRAKLTAAKAAASSVMKKIEAYNAATGSYPATTTTTAALMTTALNGQAESALGPDVSIGTPADANGQTVVGIYRCTTAGVAAYSVVWWDYTSTATNKTVAAADGLKVGPTCGTWSAAVI